MKTYRPAPMDKLTLGVTILVLALFLFVIVTLIPTGAKWPAAAEGGLFILLLVISWQVKAVAYEIRDGSLVVVRGWPFRDIVIPLSEVREVRPVKFTAGTLRTFGVGGLFSSTGFFWNKQLGSFFATVTNMNRAVLVEARRKIVISPERPEEFIADMKGSQV